MALAAVAALERRRSKSLQEELFAAQHDRSDFIMHYHHLFASPHFLSDHVSSFFMPRQRLLVENSRNGKMTNNLRGFVSICAQGEECTLGFCASLPQAEWSLGVSLFPRLPLMAPEQQVRGKTAMLELALGRLWCVSR